MYFKPDIICNAISALSVVHPFHGITFLTCKKGNLPVGKEVDFKMDALTKEFMVEHHKIDPKSKFYYQPFKSVVKWLRHDYPASGLQAINTQTFSGAFIHRQNSRIWGWRNSYIQFLNNKR